MLTPRENWIRTVEFKHPEYIICEVGFSASHLEAAS